MQGESVYGSGMALSKGLAATANFIPLTDWRTTAGIKKLRATLQMQGDTGTCLIAPAYQTIETRTATGDTPVQIGALSFLGANGFQYPTEFTDVSTDVTTKQLIRFGVLVKQDSDGGIQGCLASIKVEINIF